MLLCGGLVTACGPRAQTVRRIAASCDTWTRTISALRNERGVPLVHPYGLVFGSERLFAYGITSAPIVVDGSSASRDSSPINEHLMWVTAFSRLGKHLWGRTFGDHKAWLQAMAITALEPASVAVSGIMRAPFQIDGVKVGSPATRAGFVLSLGAERGRFRWGWVFPGHAGSRSWVTQTLLVDHRLVVVGGWVGDATMGGRTVTSRGEFDLYVAQLDPASGTVKDIRVVPGSTGTYLASLLADRQRVVLTTRGGRFYEVGRSGIRAIRSPFPGTFVAAHVAKVGDAWFGVMRTPTGIMLGRVEKGRFATQPAKFLDFPELHSVGGSLYMTGERGDIAAREARLVRVRGKSRRAWQSSTSPTDLQGLVVLAEQTKPIVLVGFKHEVEFMGHTAAASGYAAMLVSACPGKGRSLVP